MKLVCVEWNDSISGSRWVAKDTAIKEGEADRCFSVGILAKETDKEIVLIPNMSLICDNVLHDLTIPKGCIIRIRQMRIK